MRGLVVLLLAAALVGAGCGDNDDGGGGGGGGGGGTVEPTVEVDDGCDESFPHRQDPPPEYDGFVVLCDDGLGAVALAVRIENISDTAVISATPINQAWTTADVTPVPEPRFAQAQVQLRVPPSCDQSSCTLPPGTRLSIAADVPVRATLDTLEAETMAAAVAYSGLSALNAKLGTPGQRLVDQAVACYQTVAAIGVTDRPYEEQFRSMLGLQGCYSLYQDIAQEGADPPLGQPGAFKAVYNRAQRLLGASFNDAMVFLFKIAPR